MTPEFQKGRFLTLRFDYYVAGRSLWLTGQMPMACLMLAYAVEVHLKHIMVYFKAGKKADLFSHDPRHLVKVVKESGLLDGVKFSSDLIDYTHDVFNQRYPSQTWETGKEAAERDHALSYGAGNLLYFDDLILQIDDWFADNADWTFSIGVLAGQNVDSFPGKAFFHSNASAQERFPKYKAYAEQHWKRQKYDLAQSNPDLVAVNESSFAQRIAALEDPQRLLNSDIFNLSIGTEEKSTIEMASRFKYPGRILRNDSGDVIGVSAFA